MGLRPGEQLPELYRSFDVVIVPSLSTPGWTEQFCRVAVEAMASGVPVIASDSGALPEVVGDAGLLVPPGDPAALRGALNVLASDPDRRIELGRRGRTRSGRFAWETIAKEQLDFYAEVALMDDLPPIHVVIVAYGSPLLLERCLGALGDGLEVIIVDNSSSEEVSALAERHGCRYIDQART